MTLVEACTISVMRAGAAAALASLAAPMLLNALRAPSQLWLRRALWVWVLLPLLTPPILVGYGWSNLSARLVHDPLAQQALYALLVLLRLTPAAVLVLALSPRPSASPEALHCHRLLGRRLPLALWLRGPARARIAAAAVVALLAFGEFEIASLLGAGSWTVWLFDAQAGGLPLSASLRLAAIPVALQASGVTIVVAALWPARQGDPQTASTLGASPHRRRVAIAGAWSLAAVALTVAAPAGNVLPGAWRGFGILWDDLAIAQDLQHSLMLAAAAAALALTVVRFSAHLPRAAMLLLCMPGLLGSLVIGLLVLGLFQLPLLRGGYDTAAPLLLALTLLLLPIGVVLGALLGTLGRGEPVHTAALLGAEGRGARWASAQRLAHELVGRAWWGLAIILFYLAYFDLPASALLAPSGMTPAVVRLYNLMHYGRMATLSAMVVLTLVMPLLILLAIASLHRAWMQARSAWFQSSRALPQGVTL